MRTGPKWPPWASLFLTFNALRHCKPLKGELGIGLAKGIVRCRSSSALATCWNSQKTAGRLAAGACNREWRASVRYVVKVVPLISDLSTFAFLAAFFSAFFAAFFKAFFSVFTSFLCLGIWTSGPLIWHEQGVSGLP
jgi:hypothetical protein